MGQDTTKLLDVIVVKLEIGLSAAGSEPSSYVDLGLYDEENTSMVTRTMVDLSVAGWGGQHKVNRYARTIGSL